MGQSQRQTITRTVTYPDGRVETFEMTQEQLQDELTPTQQKTLSEKGAVSLSPAVTVRRSIFDVGRDMGAGPMSASGYNRFINGG